MASWLLIGDAANVAQLSGLNAVQLIAMIVRVTADARMHKKNCQEFAEYLQLIGSFLEPLNMSELVSYPETKALLERLEKALRKSYILVNSCRDRHFVYLLVMGWSIANQFRRAELEIERYVKLIPLISLVDQQRLRERRQRTERDRPDENNNVQDASANLGTPRMGRSSTKTAISSFLRGFKNVFVEIFKPKRRRQLNIPTGTELHIDDADAGLRIFKLNELSRATGGFAPGNIVGRGEFTIVYVGEMDNISVAVKMWLPGSGQGSQEWETEKNTLKNMSHPNLIKLLGYCNEENNFLLVYEFMANGSLENHLLGGGEPLSWDLRVKIATGAARGLAFLHMSERHIIHRGVKPSVILLDSNFNTKLSGLGWSRDGPTGGEPGVSTSQVLGTPGYLDPHYIETGYLDEKTDVYAFGIILLQMLLGQKVFDHTRPTGKRHILQLAKPIFSKLDRLPGLIDPKLKGEYPVSAAQKLAAVCALCTDVGRDNRPRMDIVVKALERLSRMRSDTETEGSKPVHII